MVAPAVQNHQQTRKRRRGEVANPANTLDGLVAKRADDIGASDSLIKRYLTENEAIESPSDDQELKVFSAACIQIPFSLQPRKRRQYVFCPLNLI